MFAAMLLIPEDNEHNNVQDVTNPYFALDYGINANDLKMESVEIRLVEMIEINHNFPSLKGKLYFFDVKINIIQIRISPKNTISIYN
ncbi:hypothetical protein HZS_7631 [Henneguya salminicola]|nr:hypothetical protein HZS_7631 [Henneguya salminicola]